MNRLLPALGPLIMIGVFIVVLYAIHLPINLIVVVGLGLVYWPFYQLMGLFADLAIARVFMGRRLRAWRLFRNGFFS